MSNRDQTPPPPPAGYVPPPSGASADHLGPTAVEAPRKKSWFARHKVLTGVIAVLLLGSCVNAVTGGDEDEAPAAPTSTQTSSEPAHASDEEGTGSSASSSGSTADEPAAEEDAAEEPAAAVEQQEPAAEEVAAVPTVGDTVTVDDFEVTVTGVETGITSVGPEGWGEEPQGQFVKVLVTVTNTGTSAEMFFDSEQKLIDEQDREHSTSSAAYLLDGASLWLTDINPGNTATGALLFDIPVDAQPVTITVSSGFFGSTADIDLAG